MKKDLADKIESIRCLQNRLNRKIEEVEKMIINQPTKPEGYQGLNKWYLNSFKKGAVIFVTNESHDTLYGYGMGVYGNWFDKETGFSTPKDLIKRLATDTEIKEAILKGCEQNGIVEGVRVKSLHGKDIITIGDLSNTQYYKSNDLWCSGAELFNNGKFADVVKEEKVKECTCKTWEEIDLCKIECNRAVFKSATEVKEEKPTDNPCTCKSISESMRCTKKCDRDSKPTDKELLKECEVLLCEIESEDTCNPSTDYKIRELLTKLNKHLNHE